MSTDKSGCGDVFTSVAEARDCAREALAELGFLRYRVLLVKTRWTGEGRGFGHEIVVSETELLPRPRVEGISAIVWDLEASGRDEEGVVECYVSALLDPEFLYPSDIGELEDFWWEIVSPEGKRRRFTPESIGELEPMETERRVVLYRSGSDRDEDGNTAGITAMLRR